MRRSAILSVMAAVLCYGSPQPPAQPVSQEKADASAAQKAPPPVSLSPAIPVPGAADAADPAKMAAAPSEPGGKLLGGVAVDQGSYIIGAEDILNVYVWSHPEFTGQFMVRPDGKISIPLVDELQAAGLTPLQLKDSIKERLRGAYIKDPNVSVGLSAVKSKKYYINGEVYKPGVYDLVVPTNVLEALVNAGGFKDFANKKRITILRKNGKVYFFNYNEVSKGKHPEQNIMLEHGDQINVK